MKNPAYDNGYGTRWSDIHVTRKEGYYTSVSDYHEHDFYEINLILSGKYKVLLPNRAKEAEGCSLVLTGPNTPHFVTCSPDVKYSRLYALFTEQFLRSSDPVWQQMATVFGERGKFLLLTPCQQEQCEMLICRIGEEENLFRKKLLLMYLLSWLSEFTGADTAQPLPAYLMQALDYIESNYQHKITAQMLSQRLFVGRTTLMTTFKKYTGMTMQTYLQNCRLRHAIVFLREGRTQDDAAQRCGLGDSSNLIRSFHRCFQMTPRQYLMQQHSEEPK